MRVFALYSENITNSILYSSHLRWFRCTISFIFCAHLCKECLLFWSTFSNVTLFVLSVGHLEEKEQQLQALQAEVERLTTEHANSAEKFSSELNRVVAEGEEKRRDLQAHFDATFLEKSEEYKKLEEQLASLKDDYTREVCVLLCWHWSEYLFSLICTKLGRQI